MSTIIALLLMLHWAAPSLLPLEISVPSKSAGPALSSETSVTQQGNLPRAVPRPLAFESAQSKPQRHDWCADGKLESLHASIDWAPPPTFVADRLDARDVLPAPRPTGAFFARGPPSPV